MKLPQFFFKDKAAYDVKGHLAHVRELHGKYTLNSKEKCDRWTESTLEVLCEERIPYKILRPLKDTIEAIYDHDEIYRYAPPTLEDREYLEKQQHQLSELRIDTATSTLTSLFSAILKQAPAGIFDEHASDNLTVPLHVLMRDYRDLVQVIVTVFSQTRYADNYAFPGLYSRLVDNVFRVSGVDRYNPGTKKLLTPLDYDGDPTDFLAGTPFEDFFCAQVPFAIPHEVFSRHGIILAPPGHGKTQLLGSLVAGFVRQDDNSPGLFVLDPHGDLFQAIRQRIDARRLVVLDPDDSPPPLNFLDFGTSTEAQTLQTFSYLMSSLSGGLSDKQGAIVPYLLKLLRKIPQASLETLRLLVDEKVKNASASAFAKYIAALPATDQGFFHNQYFSNRMQETKDAIGWKLYSALSSDAFRTMFSAKENSVNFDQLFAERKVVLVKGGRNALGDDGMRVFFQYIIAQFFAAGLRRERLPADQRHLCILFGDEAHVWLNSSIIANILVELRKYGCGLWQATQVYEQIGPEVRAAILGATGTKICGPIQFSDANVLAREMYTTPDFIRTMKARERESADWAFYVSGMTDRAVKVTVPYGTLEAMPAQNTVRHEPAPHTAADKTNPEQIHIPIIPPTKEDLEDRVAEQMMRLAERAGLTETPEDLTDDVHTAPMKKI
jgi:hypothetical protein